MRLSSAGNTWYTFRKHGSPFLIWYAHLNLSHGKKQSLRHCRIPTTYWKTRVLWDQGENARVDHSMIDKTGAEGGCRRGEFRGSSCEIGSPSGNSIGDADVHTLHQWYQREHQLHCEVVCRWLPHIQAHLVSAGCNSPAGGPRPAVKLARKWQMSFNPDKRSVLTITRK